MKAHLFLTVSFSGLVAGLLYAYSCSVNPGLKTLPNTEYVRAMQSINTAIQNPLFFVFFLGLLVLFPVTTYLLHQRQHAAFPFVLVAMLIYFIGVFGVTVFGNIPLNNQLARFPTDTATAIDYAVMRQAFERPWNMYHSLRTIASALSFGFTIFPLIKNI